MHWLRVSILLEAGSSETRAAAAEDVLLSLGAVSVTLTGAGDDPVLEPAPGAAPLWERCRLEALFEVSLDLAGFKESLREADLAIDDVEFVDDAGWTERWRLHSVEACFGNRLWLIPRDAEAPAGPALRLDPGLAFGSGSHPTTRLCLEWLACQALAGKRVLDFGCGSGVLGLAALKLGGARLVAVDHDPQALLATRENAAYNALADDRLMVVAPDELPDEKFDFVLANILANPLIELAPLLTGRMAASAVIILSGMLEEQAPSVAAAYPGIRFEPPMVETDEQGSRWVLLSGRRSLVS